MSTVPMPLRPRHWSFALGGALLLHAALALVFHQLVQGGTVAPGRGGIEVGLPPAGAAAGAPAEAAAAEAAPAALPEAAEVPPETVPEVAPLAEVVEAEPAPPEAAADPPTAEPLYAPVETVEAVVPPEAPVRAEAAAPVEPETAAVEAVEPMEEAVADSVMAVPPPPRAKPRPPVVEEAPETEVADAEPAEPAPEPTEMAAVATGAQEGPRTDDEMVGNDGKAGAGNRAATGAAEGHSGGGAAGAFVDYKAQLLAWLEKHKEYPRRARLRRQQGTAVLHFVMDRNGRVLEYSIKASSGYRLLDEEVVAMIQRASPLPAPPPALAGERFDYTVPVEFSQR